MVPLNPQRDIAMAGVPSLNNILPNEDTLLSLGSNAASENASQIQVQQQSMIDPKAGIQSKCLLALDDDKILSDIFNTRIRQDDGNVKNKQDIHAKKILRSAKEYYEQKLESKLQYKKIRRNLSRLNSDKVMRDWKCFLDYTDQLVKLLFSAETLKLFNVTYTSLSNHIAALMQSQGFQCEMETIESQVEEYQQMKHTGQLES